MDSSSFVYHNPIDKSILNLISEVSNGNVKSILYNYHSYYAYSIECDACKQTYSWTTIDNTKPYCIDPYLLANWCSNHRHETLYFHFKDCKADRKLPVKCEGCTCKDLIPKWVPSQYVLGQQPQTDQKEPFKEPVEEYEPPRGRKFKDYI